MRRSGAAWCRPPVRDLFARGRAGQPSVLFFDEIEALVAKRSTDATGGARDAVQERVLSTLLNEMDGVEAAEHVLVVVRVRHRPKRMGRHAAHLAARTLCALTGPRG